ncbi:glycerate kinase family protein [Knoellia aerolata]|uniref:Glycerate kinase n=1 Tax=Knoellia aerolata DSM 18566 TaxID=1385519 RepID=A0A0A0JWP1_9MICO|nr:glycerate kinase [Knoellia aerolata]KGN41099.1 glycerate kinase [Knoellia aerolata DSM 18566]
MHVVIAPDCFTGTLTATQAAEAMAAGWHDTAPGDTLTLLPLSDGGPGFLDVLAHALGGTTVALTVSDPLGREVPAAVLVTGDPGDRTAYVESAQAAGLHLLAADERNPALTSTWGVGQLVRAALTEQPRRIVVGLGGSGTNDGGAGMLAALGAGPAESLARGGSALATAPDDALSGLLAVRGELADVELVIASDVDNPLLGFKGASAVFSPQKGATPEVAQELEAALGRFSEIVARTVPAPTDLLTGAPRRLEREPGAGAAGGLGYALMLLGGHRVSGVQLVLDAVGFHDVISGSDLVVTGEGTFDWQSLSGKVASGVAEAALGAGLPTVVLAGQVLVGRRETMGLGISGAYAVAETPAELEAAMLDPVGTLRARAARVARTWSPAR